jgi:hypothetical protein
MSGVNLTLSESPPSGNPARLHNRASSGGGGDNTPRSVKFIHPKTKQVVAAGVVYDASQPAASEVGDVKVPDGPVSARISVSGGQSRPPPPSINSSNAAQAVNNQVVTDAMQNERFLKILQRDFCNLEESLLVPGRCFILESRALRTKSFGRKDEYTIHLFSDMMCYSEKTVRGFFLHKMLSLDQCTAYACPEEHPYAFKIVSANKSGGHKDKEVIFTLETMREFLLWLYQLRLFITRSKKGLKGKPKNWNPQVEESRFTNRKTYWLLQRKNRLKERIVVATLQDQKSDEPIQSRFPESGPESKAEFDDFVGRQREDSDLEFEPVDLSPASGSAPTKAAPLIPEDEEVVHPTLEEAKERPLPAVKKPVGPLNRTMSSAQVGSPRTPTGDSTGDEKSPSRKQLKSSKSVDDLYIRPSTSKFKPNKSRENMVISEKTYNSILSSRDKHSANRQHYMEVLKKGTWMTKHDGRGNELTRWFRVSDDGTELLWGKTEGKTTSSAHLADATRLEFGPFSERFRFYRWEREKAEGGRPWLCFTIYFFERDRTIDLECNSEQELRDWFFGLQYLIPLWSAFWLSKGELLWTHINMKADQIALERGLTRASAYRLLFKSNEKLPQSGDPPKDKDARDAQGRRKKNNRNQSADLDEVAPSSPSLPTGSVPDKNDPAVALVPSSPRGKNY